MLFCHLFGFEIIIVLHAVQSHRMFVVSREEREAEREGAVLTELQGLLRPSVVRTRGQKINNDDSGPFKYLKILTFNLTTAK